MLFFDAGGLADLINRALLVADEPSVVVDTLGHAIRPMRSKTDQEGAPNLIQISATLHTLITEWQDKYQLEGVILGSVAGHGNVGDKLNSGSIGAILNRLKASLGSDVNNCRFSGHSFRVGAAIDLLEAGASLETIMLKGGWRSQDNAMNYVRGVVIKFSALIATALHRCMQGLLNIRRKRFYRNALPYPATLLSKSIPLRTQSHRGNPPAALVFQ